MKRILLVGALLVASGASARAFAQAVDGKVVYDENCKKCHGVRGIPPVTMKKKFEKIATFDAAFLEKRSDDSIVTILTKGKGEGMKSFKDKMTKDEMAAVAKYVHELATKSKQ
jgi:mono/diheme cytochrome c family protein